jgi:hypothetical protein
MKKAPRPVWNSKLSAAENAKAVLPGLASHFFAAGRRLAARPVSPKKLHQFRLETKRFRYSLELFRPCYGSGLEDRLKALKSIQDFLGDLNDCISARELVDASAAATPRQKKLLQRYLESRVATKQAGFRKHWREVFDAPGREKNWVAYLKNYAGRNEAPASTRGRRTPRGVTAPSTRDGPGAEASPPR